MLFQTLLSLTVISGAIAQGTPKTAILARLWSEPNATGDHEDIRDTKCHNLIRLKDNVESVSALKEEYRCSLFARLNCQQPPEPQVVTSDGPVDDPNVYSVQCSAIPLK